MPVYNKTILGFFKSLAKDLARVANDDKAFRIDTFNIFAHVVGLHAV